MFDEKQLLIRLLQNFYVSNFQEEDLCWQWQEDIPLSKLDPQLNKDLLEFFKENNIVSL